MDGNGNGEGAPKSPIVPLSDKELAAIRESDVLHNQDSEQLTAAREGTQSGTTAARSPEAPIVQVALPTEALPAAASEPAVRPPEAVVPAPVADTTHNATSTGDIVSRMVSERSGGIANPLDRTNAQPTEKEKTMSDLEAFVNSHPIGGGDHENPVAAQMKQNWEDEKAGIKAPSTVDLQAMADKDKKIEDERVRLAQQVAPATFNSNVPNTDRRLGESVTVGGESSPNSTDASSARSSSGEASVIAPDPGNIKNNPRQPLTADTAVATAAVGAAGDKLFRPDASAPREPIPFPTVPREPVAPPRARGRFFGNPLGALLGRRGPGQQASAVTPEIKKAA